MIITGRALWTGSLPKGVKVKCASSQLFSAYRVGEVFTVGRYGKNPIVVTDEGKEYTGEGATWEILAPLNKKLEDYL